MHHGIRNIGVLGHGKQWDFLVKISVWGSMCHRDKYKACIRRHFDYLILPVPSLSVQLLRKGLLTICGFKQKE